MLAYDRFRRSPFFKHVAILAGGTALAKVIPILASPILTRLYTPADLGLLAVFMVLVSSVTPAICGKYEVAMVLPKSQMQGLRLLEISFGVATAISLLSLSVVVLFKDNLLALLSAWQLGRWIYLAPLALLLTGLMTAMNYFANRRRDYGNMAKSQMVNSLSIATTGIILGIVGVGFWGLLMGSMVGLVATTTYLLYLYRAELSSDLLLWGRAKTELMKQYKDYPLYNASAGLLNGVTVAMPVFFLSRYFSESIVGYFSLVSRVVNTPLSFISASVSQVNLRKIADLINERTDVRPYLMKVTVGLAAIILFPTIILTLFSPTLFSLVFGEGWREAGIYMQILMPAMAVRFVASTLSTTLGATQNNRLGAIWKVTAFLVSVSVFAVFAPKQDSILLFKAVLVMDTALYLFYYLLIWKAAGNPRNQITEYAEVRQ